MPPSRARAVPEDSRSEASSTKERHAHTGQSTAKGRRAGPSTIGAGSSLKDFAQNNVSIETAPTGSEFHDGTSILAWPDFEISVLNSYRQAYRLQTPAAFGQPLNQMVLSNPGVGKYSPTMARRRERRKVHKDQLALAIRKSFNDSAIGTEPDVVVNFLYKVRWQGILQWAGSQSLVKLTG